MAEIGSGGGNSALGESLGGGCSHTEDLGCESAEHGDSFLKE